MLDCICLLPLNVDGLCILLCTMLIFLISAFILVPGYGTVFMSVHVHGVVCPFVLVLVVSSCRCEGRGCDRVVSELMLQHGPAWTTRM